MSIKLKKAAVCFLGISGFMTLLGGYAGCFWLSAVLIWQYPGPYTILFLIFAWSGLFTLTAGLFAWTELFRPGASARLTDGGESACALREKPGST